MTASEGEDDKEKNVTTTLPQSSVKVLLSFLVPQVSVSQTCCYILSLIFR